MAKKTVSVYLPEETHRRAMDNRVVKDFSGNFSRYAESLIDADLSGGIDAATKQPIIALAEMFNPTLADMLNQQLSRGADGSVVFQPRVIALFLEALHRALQRDFDPELSFELSSTEEAMLYQVRANPELRKYLLRGARGDSPDSPPKGPGTEPKKKKDGKPGPTPPLPETGSATG